jgi:hypothetical protein
MDLISFEDLVVQPYNSYFNLEKELHDVKAKLSLMEQRLKYLEEKIGYGCKGNLTLEEKIDALDIKYEELDDTIVIVEDGIQKDIKGIIKRLEEDRGNDNVKIHNDIKCLKDRVDCLEYNDSYTEDSEEEIHCVSSKNIDTPSLPSITINYSGVITRDKNYYGTLNKNIDIILQYKTIDRMTINLHNDMKCNDLLRIITETKILRLIIYSYDKLESLITLLMVSNIKPSYLQIQENNIDKTIIGKLHWYCLENKIELKVI